MAAGFDSLVKAAAAMSSRELIGSAAISSILADK